MVKADEAVVLPSTTILSLLESSYSTSTMVFLSPNTSDREGSVYSSIICFIFWNLLSCTSICYPEPCGKISASEPSQIVMPLPFFPFLFFSSLYFLSFLVLSQCVLSVFHLDSWTFAVNSIFRLAAECYRSATLKITQGEKASKAKYEGWGSKNIPELF